MQIKLGVTARDRITGFKGVVTAHAKYLTGCDQYALTPRVDKDHDLPDGHWFDESRVEVLDETSVMEPPAQPERRGGPQAGAARTS